MSTKRSTKIKKPKSDDDEEMLEFEEEKKENKPKSNKSSKGKDTEAKKLSTSTSDSAKKKAGSQYYAAYMRREGPKNPGSKDLPIGKENCLDGKKFLITGVLDSLERDECKDLIVKYGGSVMTTLSKKLDYLIVGDDAGVSKLDKAKEMGIKQINEDQLFELITSSLPKKDTKKEESEPMDVEMVPEVKKSEEKKKPTPKSNEKHDIKTEKKRESTESKKKLDFEPKKEIKKEVSMDSQKDKETLLWVDKYKPNSMAKIIGQQGEKSNARKLKYWLENWHKFHSNAEKPASKGGWNRDDGLNFKAALLSGAPGIGKTTTATLVCQELGFSYVELNASDSRSKKLLDQVLGGSVNNCSLDNFWHGNQKEALSTKKHCIIMDEVDGMAGNEDRGGVQELINAIKASKIPIICICNDRHHIKIRSLANHCFDLRFNKPNAAQIKSALMSIIFKEGIKINTELVDQLIIGANHDIRQCIHNLSMWSSGNKILDTKQTQMDIEKAIKDTKINPFEACKQVFYQDSMKPKSIQDRQELFFTDYSLMPLLVHENYLQVSPTNIKSKKSIEYLNALSDSIDSICTGDRIGRLIRTYNNWSLLPSQSIFSTVIPGSKLAGTMGLAAFPSWFGKHSKQGRVDRILQELQKHLRLKTSSNKYSVGMDYLSIFKDRLTRPLIKQGSDGVDKVLSVMNEYFLTRDDFDTILELGTWPGQVDLMTKIDSKVKAAFTRAYNKESHKNPFVMVDVKKLKKKSGNDEDGYEGMEGGDEGGAVSENESDDDDIKNDAMIKTGSGKAKAKATTSTTSKASTSKATKRAAEPKEKAPASKKKKT